VTSILAGISKENSEKEQKQNSNGYNVF
jgi:hypothetical protein